MNCPIEMDHNYSETNFFLYINFHDFLTSYEFLRNRELIQMSGMTYLSMSKLSPSQNYLSEMTVMDTVPEIRHMVT